jgi:hypothetical protein
MIELIVQGESVDLAKDFDIQINKSIAKIQEPDKRESEWTKSFTLAGTKKNNKLFSYIFDTGQYIDNTTQLLPSFNPSKKASALLLIDGVIHLSGFIRLLEVVKINDKEVVYNCSMHGQVADLFTSAENLLLSQLDFSNFNHELNRDHIIESWSTDIFDNTVRIPFAYGYGYTYIQVAPKKATVDNNTNQWRVDDHTLCLYAKTVIDKIFEVTGYSYTADSFFNSDLFKRLIIPADNYSFRDTEANAEAREFQAQLSTTANFSKGATIAFNNDSTGGNYDNGGNYNTSTYKYTVPATGQYWFNLDINGSVTETVIPAGISKCQVLFGVYADGVLMDMLSFYTDTQNSNGVTPSTFTYDTIMGTTLSLNIGQEISVKYIDTYLVAGGLISTPSNVTNINIASNWSVVFHANTYGYLQSVNFTNFFIGEDKAKDFIMNFVKMFNLYVEPTNEKTLRFVTRDEFYTGGNVDYSYKLDRSQEYEIVPCGELQNGKFKYTYKDSSELNHKEYKETTSRIYGDREVIINNDFAKGEKKVEVTFLPTLFKQFDNRYYSIIESDNNAPQGLRVLYYSGLKSTTPYKVYNTNASPSDFIDQYPLSLHIDNISNMAVDLNFGMPKVILAGMGLKYTNQNLVNKYHFNTITELSDKNAKVLRGQFHIRPLDWINLTFNKLYFIEGQYWRLNQVENYNPINTGTTKCEFILAMYYQPFVAQTKNLGRNTTGYFGDVIPIGYPIKYKGVRGGGVNIGDAIYGGKDNVNVGDETGSMGLRLNTNLGGQRVNIPKSFEKVITLNCTDFTPDESGVTYLENYKIKGASLSLGKVKTITANYTVLYDDYFIDANTATGNITITLPNPTTNVSKPFFIRKTSAANTLTIIAGDGTKTINGATSRTITANYGVLDLVSNGAEYAIK